jgi:hypothetical protein
MRIASIVPVHVLMRQGGLLLMPKQDNVIRYLTALAVFKKWNKNGLISDKDLRIIEVDIAVKYGLLSNSIFRD